MLPNRHCIVAALAAVTLAAGVATAEDAFIRLPDLPLPVPVVVVLPDGGATERRMAPHLDRLAEAGIATIRPAEAADARALAALLAMAASDPRFDGARIAMLGFGDGARLALEGGAGHAVAAVMPGCAPLSISTAGGVLLLDHPDPPAACDAFRLALGARVTHHAYLAPAHAWDRADGALWDSLLWLPSANATDAGEVAGLSVSEDAAERVAAFVKRALGLADRAVAERP